MFQNPFVLVHSKEYNAAECRPGPGWCLAFGDFKMDHPAPEVFWVWPHTQVTRCRSAESPGSEEEVI